MASEQRSSNLTTAALYVGVPVLLGASCYYLYYANKNRHSRDGSNSSDQSKNKSKNKQLTPSEHLAQLKQVGNHNFSRKNYDAAIDSYTRAIDYCKTLAGDCIKPNDLAVFYQNRAACNEALGDLEKVISDCDRAIELNENYVKAYVRRAKAYEKLGKYDKAMVDAYSANLLDKFQNQSNMILAENIVKASSKMKAANAMKNHKFSWPANQTIKSYFTAFTHDPIKEKLGNTINVTPEQLQTLLDEANKPENENNAFSMLVRGSCLSLMGDMKSAQETFDQLLALSDEQCPPRYKSNALIKKAAVVISEPPIDGSTTSIYGDLEAVNELLEQAIKIDPENPDIYLHKSQALALSDKLVEAIEALNKAIALKEDFQSAIAQRFYIEFKLQTSDPLASLDKLSGLLDQFKEAVKANPNSADLHQMYAQVLSELNYFEQADQVLLDMSKIDPTDANVYVTRALLQFHMKNDPDDIANMMQQALKIDPKILFAYEILGSIETQRGKLDEAIRLFETALQYARNEGEFTRCYSLLDSAISQKAAAELIGTQA
uniref:Mitochondrial import receptor subunit TOM70 n=1 Tax=Aceria tosichella TaxID=561515 RepID=A0A6G1SFC1_9ACAR